MKTYEGNAKHSTGKTFDFQPPEAREWLYLDKMSKCKKVMVAWWHNAEYDPQNK